MNIHELLPQLSTRSSQILGEDQFHKYAILLPLIEQNGETHVLFEVRAYHLRRQPGEICFPGGKVDAADSSEKNAAIRETKEELQVDLNDISVIAPLDYLVTSGSIIYPFVGIIHKDFDSISPNPGEVEELFTVPLQYFLETEPALYKVPLTPSPGPDFPFNLIPGGRKYNWRLREIDEMFYLFENRVIWGLTAKIVHHFSQVVKDLIKKE
jgi:peroxisomal coenzyme A diphosphatase NUDT7